MIAVGEREGTKVLADNIFYENLAYGIQAYATARNPAQRNIRVVGNIAFNNGTISQRYKAKGNILVGGDVPLSGIEVSDNLLFFAGSVGENLRLGYAPVANGDAIVTGNFVWGGETALKIGAGTWATLRVENSPKIPASAASVAKRIRTPPKRRPRPARRFRRR